MNVVAKAAKTSGMIKVGVLHDTSPFGQGLNTDLPVQLHKRQV